MPVRSSNKLRYAIAVIAGKIGPCIQTVLFHGTHDYISSAVKSSTRLWLKVDRPLRGISSSCDGEEV